MRLLDEGYRPVLPELLQLLQGLAVTPAPSITSAKKVGARGFLEVTGGSLTWSRHLRGDYVIY